MAQVWIQDFEGHPGPEVQQYFVFPRTTSLGEDPDPGCILVSHEHSYWGGRPNTLFVPSKHPLWGRALPVSFLCRGHFVLKEVFVNLAHPLGSGHTDPFPPRLPLHPPLLPDRTMPIDPGYVFDADIICAIYYLMACAVAGLFTSLSTQFVRINREHCSFSYSHCRGLPRVSQVPNAVSPSDILSLNNTSSTTVIILCQIFPGTNNPFSFLVPFSFVSDADNVLSSLCNLPAVPADHKEEPPPPKKMEDIFYVHV